MKLLKKFTLFTLIFSGQSMAFYGELDLDVIPIVFQDPKDVAVGALINRGSLEYMDKENVFFFNIEVPTVGERFQICESESKKFPFLDFPSVSDCSGFLIDHETLLTVKHCLTDELVNSCDSHYWVFDYFYYGPNYLYESVFYPDRIFECQKDKKIEFVGELALVKVQPLEYSFEKYFLPLGREQLETGEAYRSFGHPLGLPHSEHSEFEFHKVDDSGNLEIGHVYADLFAGASGSPVTNSRNEVVGVVVEGKNDFGKLQFYPGEGICRKLNHCDELGENCTAPQVGEQMVEKILGIQHLLKPGS